MSHVQNLETDRKENGKNRPVTFGNIYLKNIDNCYGRDGIPRGLIKATK